MLLQITEENALQMMADIYMHTNERRTREIHMRIVYATVVCWRIKKYPQMYFVFITIYRYKKLLERFLSGEFPLYGAFYCYSVAVAVAIAVAVCVCGYVRLYMSPFRHHLF